jgi:hypothetical protein
MKKIIASYNKATIQSLLYFKQFLLLLPLPRRIRILFLPFRINSEIIKFYKQLVELLGRGISLSQGLCLHRTTPDIDASIGIGTHDLSVWAGEDTSCLRPLGH